MLRRFPAVLTAAKPETAPLREEVMELMPENGVWVWAEDRTAAHGPVCHDPEHEPLALHPSPADAIYDPRGRAHPSSQKKGLRIHLTA